ncbi:MAG: DUF3524 domain-containing protein [Planctomycetes bacterium]|nr:DUF3524 domain-containing protein [Planctomycetota bacterium]
MARVLALNAYHGGSHRAVAEMWRTVSRHEIILRTLPARHWKWRMRHSALSFANDTRDTEADCVWATDMLDLAAWRGLAARRLSNLPHAIYFHENQFLYPDLHKQERDMHFAFTNYSSACAADSIQWNSAWQRDQFCHAADQYMAKMPDERLQADQLQEKSSVLYPGFSYHHRVYREHDKPHIVWAARWEMDKGPDIFFHALEKLIAQGKKFTLSCIGGDAHRAMDIFNDFKKSYGDYITDWGYAADGEAYWDILHQADIAVSTAHHEFFGLSMVEACAAGAQIFVPQRLSYPEVFRHTPDTVFYGQNAVELSVSLAVAIDNWQYDSELRHQRAQTMAVYEWQQMIAAWDDAIDRLCAMQI